MNSVLSAEHVSMTYGCGETAVRALDDVDIAIRAGEMLALIGPSGSGKTTLLMVLGGLLTPTSGRVLLDGKDIGRLTERERARIRLSRIGFVFQSYNLFPALTALENVRLALTLKRRPLFDATTLLRRVGLGGRLNAFPAQLSGGEKQRVAIARAVVGEPSLVLADEPTAALDSGNGLAIVELLREIAHVEGRAVIVVTHDSRVSQMADRVAKMEDGRIGA